jgi:hypothetical protein
VLYSACVPVPRIVEEGAGTVRPSFYEQLIQAGRGLFNSVTPDDLEPLMKVYYYAVELAAVAAAYASPVRNVSPRDKLHLLPRKK